MGWRWFWSYFHFAATDSVRFGTPFWVPLRINRCGPGPNFLRKDLTSYPVRLKYLPISGKLHSARKVDRDRPGFMTSIPPSQPPEKKSTMNECKHPRVQIVAREEDAEFVECLECGDIFESSEFKDMMIEDTRLKNDS